jgi:hypothetical protein
MLLLCQSAQITSVGNAASAFGRSSTFAAALALALAAFAQAATHRVCGEELFSATSFISRVGLLFTTD